jgi:fucose permease
MHFFYGVGAFFTPIVIKSFLSSDFDITITSSSFNCYNVQDFHEFIDKKPYLPSVGIKNQTDLNYNDILPKILNTKTQFTSQTKYAFWILALIQLPAPIILLAAKWRSNSESLPTYDNLEPTSSAENEISAGFSFSLEYFKSLLGNMPILQTTLLMSLLVFLFEGLQASHGGYIFSYTVEEYNLKTIKHVAVQNHTPSKQIMNRHNHSQNDDAYITALFWAFFSIGRLVSIYIATKFSSSFMILIDIVIFILLI